MNKIGIIGAMEEEVLALQTEMQVDKVKKIAGLDFHQGFLYGKSVVVVRCGIGKVNAAICTQILVDVFNSDVIINTGVAGALSPQLNIGDIVISSDAVQHDMDATGFGYNRGIIPRMNSSYFQADKKLIKIAEEASKKFDDSIQVYVERIVSGDQFVSDQHMKKQIMKDFKGYCTEMEGAAIAQTCYLNQIPFVIIRSISDKADQSAEVNFSEFVQIAANHSRLMIEHMLQLL